MQIARLRSQPAKESKLIARVKRCLDVAYVQDVGFIGEKWTPHLPNLRYLKNTVMANT